MISTRQLVADYKHECRVWGFTNKLRDPDTRRGMRSLNASKRNRLRAKILRRIKLTEKILNNKKQRVLQ